MTGAYTQRTLTETVAVRPMSLGPFLFLTLRHGCTNVSYFEHGAFEDGSPNRKGSKGEPEPELTINITVHASPCRLIIRAGVQTELLRQPRTDGRPGYAHICT